MTNHVQVEITFRLFSSFLSFFLHPPPGMATRWRAHIDRRNWFSQIQIRRTNRDGGKKGKKKDDFGHQSHPENSLFRFNIDSPLSFLWLFISFFFCDPYKSHPGDVGSALCSKSHLMASLSDRSILDIKSLLLLPSVHPFLFCVDAPFFFYFLLPSYSFVFIIV